MPKRKTSLTPDAATLDEAKPYCINVSAAAAAVKAERQARLKAELRPTIKAYNQWIAENGIPLAKYRKF